MMLKYIICSTFLIHSSIAALPSYFPRCSINDPKLNDCILKAAEQLQPRIKDGIRELGIPSFNPFYIPKIEMQQGTDRVNYKVSFTNMSIYGLADYKFSELNYIPDELTFSGKGNFNNMSMKTKFDVEGRLLSIPIHGSGNYVTKLGPCTVLLKTTGKLVERNGDEYYEPIKAVVDIQVSDYVSNFTGLFEDNPDLKRVFTQVLDDNANVILQEVLPAINQVAEGMSVQLINAITRSVPYKELLPPSM
ncbi:hypothetical protein PPYR_11127 [Photinus pyralis]|uniref:Haemolymph juvenile hormone binding protein n=1 Tax=Photinus pyralis TaxID=7054 RepID=A0A1Y1MUI0_PHOPY|nr:protein takeout-like [Photinus pyralis]KAB0794288.1 hypothetical protein PPYR_11127 [Photinus pyralis]